MSLKKEMTQKAKEKSLAAEKKLKSYIQKKYGEINLGFVSEGISETQSRRFNEAINKRRILK